MTYALPLAMLLACLPPAYGATLIPSPAFVSGTGYTFTGYDATGIDSLAGKRVTNTGDSIGTANKIVSSSSRGLRGITWGPASESELAPLDPLNSVAYEEVLDINVSGVVVGRSRTSTAPLSYRAVRWDHGVPNELGYLGSSNGGLRNSAAIAINESGTIAGYSEKFQSGASVGLRAVRWAPNSTHPIELASLGTTDFALARAINSRGDIVGTGSKSVSGSRRGTRALRWEANGTSVTELGILSTNSAGYSQAEAIAINDTGMSVGSAQKYNSGVAVGTRAVRWLPGATQAIELGDLGLQDGFTTAAALAVNSMGNAVGTSMKYVSGIEQGRYAVRWDAGGVTAIELESLHNRTTFQSLAYAVNDLNYAAGMSESDRPGVNFNTNDRAVVWRPDGSVLDLTSLEIAPLADDSGTWILSVARSISSTGFVSGQGLFDPDGPGSSSAYHRGFVILVPEAGTYGRGDANFDTHIDFDDLLVIAQHYGASSPTQDIHVGDFDLNGSVNFDDLLALAQHYEAGDAGIGAGFDERFASDWALARSIAPEPAIGLLALVQIPLRRRRVG